MLTFYPERYHDTKYESLITVSSMNIVYSIRTILNLRSRPKLGSRRLSVHYSNTQYISTLGYALHSTTQHITIFTSLTIKIKNTSIFIVNIFTSRKASGYSSALQQVLSGSLYISAMNVKALSALNISTNIIIVLRLGRIKEKEMPNNECKALWINFSLIKENVYIHDSKVLMVMISVPILGHELISGEWRGISSHHEIKFIFTKLFVFYINGQRIKAIINTYRYFMGNLESSEKNKITQYCNCTFLPSLYSLFMVTTGLKNRKKSIVMFIICRPSVSCVKIPKNFEKLFEVDNLFEMEIVSINFVLIVKPIYKHKKIYDFSTTKLLANFRDFDIFRKSLNYKRQTLIKKIVTNDF
ncbi:hypothetical protein AGLY_015234 [Aphis glycines]|uniref:Uncharacterized protein n=1 Tax=Aphis glycines TaxID=307491 RepID=A0A6G0T3B6_APHGL|nr:hypothetical protein AGLY_015234 [Aphis glycines]